MDKIVGKLGKMNNFVTVYWFLILRQHDMKSKQLKRLEMYKVRINPDLNIYSDMDLFPNKTAEANTILANVGLPKALSDRL